MAILVEINDTDIAPAGAACYSRFSKYAAAIAQSRGEDYRREWYIADAHNKASLAVDSHALNKAIYWMYTKESKSWPEVARALNEKYRLDGTRGREPLSAVRCHSAHEFYMYSH